MGFKIRPIIIQSYMSLVPILPYETQKFSGFLSINMEFSEFLKVSTELLSIMK